MAKLSEEMKQLVERQRLGFVATICPDGTPSVSRSEERRVGKECRL